MNMAQFTNGLRKLRCIDMSELVAAGVIESGDTTAWARFRDAPHDWMIRASDADALKVWRIMERSVAPEPANG